MATGDFMSGKGLTPPKLFNTNLPFLRPQKVKATKEDGVPDDNFKLVEDEKQKIVLQSISEFCDHHVKGSFFDTDSQVVLLHDGNGQPLIFTVGTNKHLYVLSLVNGGGQTWQTSDITPKNNKHVQAFDAALIDGFLVLAVAQKSEQSYSTISSAKLILPRLDPQATEGNHSFNSVEWNAIENKLGDRTIQKTVTKLSCEPYPAEDGEQEAGPLPCPYRVIVSTLASSKYEASLYYVDPSPKAPNPWKNEPLAVSAGKILDCVSASPYPTKDYGHYILSQSEGTNAPINCTMSAELSRDVVLHKVGKPNSLWSSMNRWGYTDLLVSTNNGIAFFDHEDSDEPCKVLLDSVGFSNAVCSEHSLNSDPAESVLVVFGLSKTGDLYYFEGRRGDGKPEFSGSGVPIRSDLRFMSGRLNPVTYSTELVYVLRSSDQVYHLSRDPSTGFWNEAPLVVQTVGKTPEAIKYAGFITTITLSNEQGFPVPQGYPVNVSMKDPTIALVNNQTYRLGNKAEVFLTDGSGCVSIVIPASNDAISCSELGVLLQSPINPIQVSEVFSIEPAQRVVNTLRQVTSGSDILNAKRSDGKPVVSNKAAVDTDAVNTAADLISKLPQFKTQSQSGSTQESIIVLGNAGKELLEWFVTDEGQETTASLLGDVIESMKQYVKEKVQAVMKVVGPVVKFVVKIFGKIFRFLIDTTKAALECVGRFLEDVLGIDLSALRDWFKHLFGRVDSTQAALKTIITSGISATQRILRVNEQVLKDSFDFYGKLLEMVISRPSPRKAGPVSTFMTNIMNNPIIKALLNFNPMSWVMEAVNEEMGDSVKLPSFPFLSTLSSTAVRVGLSGLRRIMVLFERLFENLVTIISDPTKAEDVLLDSCRAGFWSAFEGVKEIVLELYGLVVALFKDMDTFLNDVWVLPGLTDLWSDYTGMDFSLMNLLTYILAQIIEIFYDGKKAAFDGWDLEAMFGGKNISDEQLKLFDVPKDVPLHSIQMAHIPVPSPVNTPLSASSANRQAEALSTRQSNPNSRIQVTKSASVSMPEMTITRSAGQFSGSPGDGLPGSSGSSDGTSTDKKNGPIDDNTKDFLKVIRVLKFIDGLWRLIALNCQPGVWKPAAPDFGADAPRVEGRRGTFDDLYGGWPRVGNQRNATLDLDSLGLIDDVGPKNIAAVAQSSDYLATTIMNGLSILTKAVEITWVLTKLPSDRLQSVGNIYGLGLEGITAVSAVMIQSIRRNQSGSVAGNCLIHAGHVGSLFWGRLSGAGENADWALVGASGLGIAGSILVTSQEPNSRIAGQVCVGLDTGIVIGHGVWAFKELAQ